MKNMKVASIYYLKILVFLLFLLSSSMFSEGASDLSLNSNAIYRKILKMRTLPFEDCGSTYDILFLSISCCTKIPCQMRRGSNALVNVIFDDNGKNTSYLKHRVSWIFNAIRSNALISPDPCDGVHECLVSSSDGKSYYATVHVNDSLPCIRGTMLWEAVDERGNIVMCFRIPIVIVH